MSKVECKVECDRKVFRVPHARLEPRYVEGEAFSPSDSHFGTVA